MHTIRRLLALWRLYAYMDFQLLTRSLRLFMTWFITDTTVNIASIAAMLLMAERFDGIGVWSKPQLLFMLSYATLVNGLLDTFFGYNVLFISRRLGRGQLDHMLVQPLPLGRMLVTEGFTPAGGTSTLIPGLGLLFWSASQLHLTITPVWWGLLVVHLVRKLPSSVVGFPVSSRSTWFST